MYEDRNSLRFALILIIKKQKKIKLKALKYFQIRICIPRNKVKPKSREPQCGESDFVWAALPKTGLPASNFYIIDVNL